MAEWKRVAPAPAVSPAKLAANAANAQHSTGPRTPEGKARSAANSRKHGLTAAEVVVHPDEQELWAGFLADNEADLQPSGILELTLFNQIVHAAWSLRRVRMLEAELFDGSTDPLADENLDRRLDRLARYARRFENSLHRGLRELRNLQTNRSQRASILPAVRETIPPRADTARSVLAAKRTHPSNAREADMRLLLASIEREPEVYRARSEANTHRSAA
jgi:hypothetical protein